jgi:hypothetical protein
MPWEKAHVQNFLNSLATCFAASHEAPIEPLAYQLCAEYVNCLSPFSRYSTNPKKEIIFYKIGKASPKHIRTPTNHF